MAKKKKQKKLMDLSTPELIKEANRLIKQTKTQLADIEHKVSLLYKYLGIPGGGA